MPVLILNNTPVETYMINTHKVYVKREDLSCPDGPPFSKTRGVIEHLTMLKSQGISRVVTLKRQYLWRAGQLHGHVPNYV